MACPSRLSAALGLVLPVLARASWAPRPLTDYESDLPAEGSAPGVRRFRHREVHQFEDGTDLELSWEVDADPESILSLDLEHPRGARVHECRSDRLTLHVRHEHAAQAARWRHVTASDSVHRCSHLEGFDLYHRIVRVDSVRRHSRLHDMSVVQLATEELESPARVFPHCRYYFNLVPFQAKDPSERARSFTGRRLATPLGSSAHNLLDLDIPTQMGNMGYNWDYNRSSTLNPQYKFTFPGGVGFMRLYQPYVRSHYRLNINFTSRVRSLSEAPHVTVLAELRGRTDFNLNLAAAVNFNKERSAGVLTDVGEVLRMFELPGPFDISNLSNPVLRPIRFYIGGTPLTIKPGFSCKLKAYHIGFLKGSLRVGLSSQITMHGVVEFDSKVGVWTNLTARADDINFTAPTWMLFTDHFEMGAMLEPEFWLNGAFADVKDMKVGFALRPFFNVSIVRMQPNITDLAASAVAGLAVYPFRAVGLPAGRNFAIRVSVNGQSRQTDVKYSTGVVEYNTNITDFYFGPISQGDLLSTPIQVALLEDGQDIASGQAICEAIENGTCSPNPVSAEMQVDGKNVYVHLSAMWDQNATTKMLSKVKSVLLRFPVVTVGRAISQQLASPEGMAAATLRVTRSGRSYSVPLAQRGGSSVLLKSIVIYDLGPVFQAAWKSVGNMSIDQAAQDLLTPQLDLLIGGSVVATGRMPQGLTWDNPTTLAGASKLASNIQANLRTFPVTVPMYAPGGGTLEVAAGQIEVDVLPPDLSAFWVYPFQQEEFTVGKNHTLYWTLSNAKQGKPINFTLTAMEVRPGRVSLVPTTWQMPVRVECSLGLPVPVMRYTGGVQKCLFKHAITVPSALAGKQIVLVASWLGGAVLAPHWMLSTPVLFSSGRRLKTKGTWGTQDLGAVNHTGFGTKVRSRLQKLRSKCSNTPLEYQFGAGMNFVSHMKNVIVPFGGGGTVGSTRNGGSTWTSDPIPIIKPLRNGEEGNQFLMDLLPEALCHGGVCDGIMPGCNNSGVSPMMIEQIEVRLSRPFRWQNKISSRLRHMIAYGLALVPSVLKVYQAQSENTTVRRLQTSLEGPLEPAPPSRGGVVDWALPGKLKTNQPYEIQEGRFEIEDSDGEDEEVEGAELDSFILRVTEPIHYELTDELLEKFRRQGAFRGISDGRERTHGPVEVASLKLRRPPGSDGAAASEALYQVSGRLAEGGEAAGPVDRHGRNWSPRAAATSVACVALFGAAIVVARAAVGRRGYAPVGPVDALVDTKLFA